MAAVASEKRELLELLEHLEPLALARLASLGPRALAQGTSSLTLDSGAAGGSNVLSLDWPELEHVLPDRGFPRGVIEIASPITKQGAMRGGATTISLSAVRAVHAADSRAWCAWITEANAPPLYAPAVAQAGVDLDRLLVVRPQPADLARTVVKTAASGAFELVIVDAPAGLDGKLSVASSSVSRSARPTHPHPTHPRPTHSRPTHSPRPIHPPRVDGSVIVRKLALAAEEKGTTFILLTNVFTSRSVPWPVALRIEVERRPEAIAVRVTKDRRGRASSQHVVRVAC